MQELEKRIADNRLFDVDCTDLLDENETITSATVAAAASLVFGAIVVNAAPITYPMRKRTAQPGKAMQVRISAGALATGAHSQHVMLTFLLVTNINPALQVTVCLVLTDGTEGC